MKTMTDRLVELLAKGTDLEAALGELGLTAPHAARLLKTRKARRQLNSRRSLAKLHAILIAGRFSPYAVQQMCKLLEDEKAEIRLRSASAILKTAGVEAANGKAGGGAKALAADAPAEGEAATEEDGRVIVDLGRKLDGED